MLPQEIAVEMICASLKKDTLVQAIFLKGSMGRNEHDEHSDIDLYCLVRNEDKEAFLLKRVEHLQAYSKIIFEDDIFIVAPQLIAVYEDLLHIDLFTVTIDSFIEKDFFKVLYDPLNLLSSFIDTQGLTLAASEYRDDVMDVAWFLFQYKKAAARGNDIWAAKMLSNVMDHLMRVLLFRYAPKRAQLGMKTIERSLPNSILLNVLEILEHVTPSKHHKAVFILSQLLTKEFEWIDSHLPQNKQTKQLLQKMIEIHLQK